MSCPVPDGFSSWRRAISCTIFAHRKAYSTTNVPDPGSGAFFTPPGSGTAGKKSGIGFRDEEPDHVRELLG